MLRLCLVAIGAALFAPGAAAAGDVKGTVSDATVKQGEINGD